MNMANFPGNLSWKISFELQYRIFIVPWLKKNSAISCMKDRTYSSSFPVRFIPKKSSKIEESSDSSPVKGSEFIENDNLPDSNALRFEVSHVRRNVWGSIASNEKFQSQISTNNLMLDYAEPDFKEKIDHDSGVVDYEFMEEAEEVVEEFQTLQGEDCRQQNVPQASKLKQDAEKLAIELLATRAFTAVELRKKLHGKRFPPDIVEALINDFQSRGLINDSLYAETFSRSRWSSSSWGPIRIKQALFRKGVSEVDAEKAIKLVFRDGESDGDQESRLGLSKLSLDQLFLQASKQWQRGQNVASETRKSRIIRWLQYRGFNWGVISFILKKLESQCPP